MLNPALEMRRHTPQVSLRIGSSPVAAWQQVILPWFETVADQRGNRGTVAVVTPYRSHAYFLRRQLLARGISLLGVKFLLPPPLRDLLLRGSEFNVPLREHLRLLLAATAEALASRNSEKADRILIAKSVARDPDNFLRAFDRLVAAGWDFSEIDTAGLRDIASCFEKCVRDCGFTFVHEADRVCLDQAKKSPPFFTNLLLTGFDGAHWPLWPLLRAAVTASMAATVILSDPRDEARDLDETWVGTWEETYGAAEVIAGADEMTISSVSHSLSLPATESERQIRAEQPLGHVHFVIGRNNIEQARAVVALIAKFLADEQCDRIGVLFARQGPLARLVASLLQSAKIPHNDGIAHPTPSVFDNDAWRAWLELQRDPRLKFLLRFLRASGVQFFENISVFEVEDVLRRAYADVLLDNLEVLREYCARKLTDGRHAAIARGLEQVRFLPEKATFSEFLTQTRKIFTSLGWKEHWTEVDRLSRAWSERFPESFSKNIYLRWLRELLAAPSLSRDEFGAHPYSQVQLLPYPEAEGQAWSHLIFAGLNEEAWPALDADLGFIQEQEIHDFNSQNRVMNQRAVKRGRHGEGQWSVRENKTLLLGPTERRLLRRRQLMNLVESVSTGIGASANLYSESFPSRTANPTDFFSWLYFAARGGGVSQSNLHALEEQTRAWLKEWSPVDAQKIDSISVGRTRYAFDARRQVRAAGQYEFALRAPPERPIALRVTEWEQALRWPALIWMNVFLGVKETDDDTDAWSVATGQWVHGWLAQSAPAEGNGNFLEISRVEEIRARLLEQARGFRLFVQDLCAACGKALPDWWLSGWSNALYVADCLAAKLSDLNDWSRMAVEWPLGSPAVIPIDGKEVLRVRGRIDLILARGECIPSPLQYSDLWLIDYKTGRQRGFSLRERRRNESTQQKFRRLLIEGKGVQLALYALATNALGAGNVQLTLLGTADELKPNFQLSDALAQRDFWQELHRMQETAVFGMIGPLHSDFGFARNYPLATLPIDPDLLDEKWVLTHPAFAVSSEEVTNG